MTRRGLLLLTSLLVGFAAAQNSWDSWISRTQLPLVLAETSVEVRDRNGDLLRAYTVEDGLWRLAVQPGAVDQSFVDMLIAYEDKRYFRHNGVDPLAMIRAAGQAVRNGGVVSGGSTITMQVARLLENSGTGGWSGKLRQIRVALALERRFSKQDILALYLTHAPYGSNLEGIRAGSLAWFGKEPNRLTPAQAALLVALPQAPESRRPDRQPQAARAARDRVMLRLASLIGQDAVSAALNSPVPTAQQVFPKLAPHMADRARASDPAAQRHDLTIDLELQSSLEALAARAVRDQDPNLSVAMVVVNYQTGETLASVGSARYDAQDERRGFIDMTRAVRSPGSTLKPLIYALAFDQGLAHPETMIDDRPVMFGSYAPQNFDGQFRGQIRIRDALQQSLNIPVVLLADELGPARILAALRRAGTRPEIPGGQAGLAIALGGLGITLEDLVQLYAGLARAGQGVDVKWQTDTPQQPLGRLMSRSSAWQVGHILSGIAPPSEAARARLAYKTGTSYGYRDAWAIGYDGAHVIGVWMGRADGTPVPGAFGAGLAAPVLFEAFGRLKPSLTPLPPPPAETLIVQTAQLPQPLQVFRGRNAVFDKSSGAPALDFPPDGAVLVNSATPLTLKFRGGVPPFTVYANGAPAGTAVFGQNIEIQRPDRGYSSLSVVDSTGQSDRVEIRID